MRKQAANWRGKARTLALGIVLASMLLLPILPEVEAVPGNPGIPNPWTPHAIAGYLWNDTGVPVVGVKVYVTNQNNTETINYTTDANGGWDVDATHFPSNYSDGNVIIANATVEGNQAWNMTILYNSTAITWLNLTEDILPPTTSASIFLTDTNNIVINVTVIQQDEPYPNGSGVQNVSLWVETPTSGGFIYVDSHLDGNVSDDFIYTATDGDGLYSFYTIGTDYVGNVEAAPGVPDDSVTLDTTPPAFTLDVTFTSDVDGDGLFDNGDNITVWLNVTDAGSISAVYVNITENVTGTEQTNNIPVVLLAGNYTGNRTLIGDDFSNASFHVTIIDITSNVNVTENHTIIEIGGSITVNHYAGWNMVSIGLLNSRYWDGGNWQILTTAYNLTQLDTGLMASKWNAGSQSYTNYISGFHTPIDPENFALDTDEGYWVWFDTAGSYTIHGDNPRLRSYTVQFGWNMIGWGQVYSEDVSVQLGPQVTAGALDSIASWNTSTDNFEYYIFPTDTMQLIPGKSYFIWSDVTKTITYGGA